MHSKAEALEHMKKTDTGHQSVSLENKTGDSTVLKIGDSAKVVIKQDMKGGEHKYGFNNNKREKPKKVRLVDDETGDKHELSTVGLLGKVFSFRIVSTPHGEPNNVSETVEVDGMNLTLDQTLGSSNPHYSRVLREKMAAREAAHKGMEARRAA
ncbi:hypothetical protein JHK87_043146 [Glycine soja]|nr:hypothetical protein JHK87_043146 [Glycine soja]